MSKMKRDNIYIYLWEEFNTVYIGRTVNPKGRHYAHKHRITEPTYKFSSEHHVEHPKMIIIENDLTVEEGVEREKYWINEYIKNSPYNVLNKTKGGQVGCFNNLSDEEREKQRQIIIEKTKAYKKKYANEHKDEIKAYKKKYAENHKDEIRLKKKKYNDEHKKELSEERKKYLKKYRIEHKEEIRQKNKLYREKNKDKIKKHYKENKDKINLRHKIYAETHKEEIALYQKEYANKNKEKIASYKKEWYEAKKIKN